MKKIVKMLTGTEIVDKLVKTMLAEFEGFREDHQNYQIAINNLKQQFGNRVAEEVANAINQQAAADMVFSGYLGLKMNLEHFQNSMSPNCTWQCVDYSDYLREDIAHNLPQYREASKVLSDFYKRLTEKQRDTYDTIMEYESHLLTVGPKLAHYYGYLIGNTLLYHMIPGYHPDETLTQRYCAMLEEYFGISFLPVKI